MFGARKVWPAATVRGKCRRFRRNCTGTFGWRAPARPYHPAYLPKTWRGWWDFGEGILGDMACHYLDLAFWALKLRYPLSIAAQGPPVNAETTPAGLIVHYEFAARVNLPAVKLTWYDGGRQPDLIAQGKAPHWSN